MMSVDLGIDLGTASVLVYVKGKGVVLKEPSVVAFDRDTNVIKAIGEEARLMLGVQRGFPMRMHWESIIQEPISVCTAVLWH